MLQQDLVAQQAVRIIRHASQPLLNGSLLGRIGFVSAWIASGAPGGLVLRWFGVFAGLLGRPLCLFAGLFALRFFACVLGVGRLTRVLAVRFAAGSRLSIVPLLR